MANEYLKELESSKTASKDLNKVVDDFLSLETPDRNLMLRLIEKIDIHEDGSVDIHFNFKKPNIIKESYNSNQIEFHWFMMLLLRIIIVVIY